MNQTWENSKKPSFGPNFGLFGTNVGHEYFFQKLAKSVTRYHSQLSSCTISKKTNDPILISLDKDCNKDLLLLTTINNFKLCSLISDKF